MKSKKQKLRSQADKLWYQIIISKHPYCEKCGQPTIHAHHFFPKGLYGSLRYNINNGIGLCMKCHFFHHSRSDPSIHQAIIKKRGRSWYSELQQIACLPPVSSRDTITYYQDIIKKITKLI